MHYLTAPIFSSKKEIEKANQVLKDVFDIYPQVNSFRLTNINEQRFSRRRQFGEAPNELDFYNRPLVVELSSVNDFEFSYMDSLRLKETAFSASTLEMDDRLKSFLIDNNFKFKDLIELSSLIKQLGFNFLQQENIIRTTFTKETEYISYFVFHNPFSKK